MQPPWKFVGRHVSDKEFQAYVAQFANPPQSEFMPGYGEFITLYADGIDFSADLVG
mgnify:CR=1 FL=1